MHLKLTVKKLPHGIVVKTGPVETSIAVYHLVIIFGSLETSGDGTVEKGIQEIRNTIKEKAGIPGEQFILTKLNQIEGQYKELTSIKRTRRGLLDFVGNFGKIAFGLGTEKDNMELKKVISDNHDSLEMIVHKSNKLLTIINATNYEISENRNAVNHLLESTNRLNEWIKEIKLNQIMYKGLMFKVDVLQEHINHVRRIKDKVSRIRKDLERGFLSEDLLPMESLRSLINSPLIPMGSKFINPIEWYYSGLKVKLVNMGNELVYSINLPLVSDARAVVTTFQSFPTPNVDKNVTIQMEIEGASILNSLTGQVTDLSNQCFGTDPMVCPPLPVRRDSREIYSCKTALLRKTDVAKYCPVKVTIDRQDHFYYHDVNCFILVTWGTDIVEECLHSETISLSPGTYMLEWKGECSLCTRHHCIPGTIETGSTLRLNNTWRAVTIPKIKSFADLKLPSHLNLPSKLSGVKIVKLEELLMNAASGIKWSSERTSLTIDCIIIFLVVVFVIAVLFVYYKYCYKSYSVCNKSSNDAVVISDIETVKSTPGEAERGLLLMQPATQAEALPQVLQTPLFNTYPMTCVIGKKE